MAGSGRGSVTATEFEEAVQTLIDGLDEVARQVRRTRRAGNDSTQAILDKLDELIEAVGKKPK